MKTGAIMIPINTLEDYLQLFEKPGWEKTRSGNGYICRPGPAVGKGSVKIYGDIKTFYYLTIDFSYAADNVFLFSVDEPYIEISNNFEDAVVPDLAGIKNLIAGRGLNCHVNLGNLKMPRFFPAETKFQKEALVVREQFFREQMPGFIEESMFDMAGAIRSGGIADPRIAVLFKQIHAFPLHAEYGKTYLAGKVYEAIALLQDKANQVQWGRAALSPAEVGRLKKVISFMKAHYNQPLSMPDLGNRFELNRNKLQMGFHILTGYTVHECLLNIRVQEATALLTFSDRTIPEIAESVGFGSAKSLYDAFSKFLGIPPNHFRKALRK